MNVGDVDWSLNMSLIGFCLQPQRRRLTTLRIKSKSWDLIITFEIELHVLDTHTIIPVLFTIGTCDVNKGASMNTKIDRLQLR